MRSIFFLFFFFCTFNLSAQNQLTFKYGSTNALGIPSVFINKKNAATNFTLIGKQLSGVSIYYLQALNPVNTKPSDVIGLFFKELKNMDNAVAIWRYKPWNSWSKPIAVKAATLMPDDDVQFFYWRYKDGSYGAAMPISGNGYRTTLGTQGNSWGSKSASLNSALLTGQMPVMAVAFDKNPYTLFAKIYSSALQAIDKGENMRVKKLFPEPFKYIGWCTWNSSDMGKNLTEDEVINSVKTFNDHQFKLGWVLIDDGWFKSNDRRLQSQLPDEKKFPNGFLNMNTRLKKEFGVKYCGVWHAFNGYWNGIDPESETGKQYKNDLFWWEQGGGTWLDASKNKKTYYFIKPGTEALYRFYDNWYNYFKTQGFDFTKVDNQLVAERMAVNNYPILTLSEKIHHAIYQASNKYFSGALINCMDMTPDAYLNFGTSAVARTVEDYFPYKKNESYNLQEGNAAAHVLQAIYNSIYFSQMVYPDFDMFESGNPNAVFHAIARALNCGPIYITDKPGTQNFDVLNALVYHDGKIIHADQPLLPTADCLFQVQAKSIFKAFSSVGNTGLLGVFNAADTDLVSGKFSAADVEPVKGNLFVIYEHFSAQLQIAKRHQQFSVSLPRLGYKLYYIVPVKNGFAPMGLTQKYNAPATILKNCSSLKKSVVTLYEGGLFKAYSTKKPQSILVNGRAFTSCQYKNKVISLQIPAEEKAHPIVTFNW